MFRLWKRIKLRGENEEKNGGGWGESSLAALFFFHVNFFARAQLTERLEQAKV